MIARTFALVLLFFVIGCLSARMASAQTTEFTYQGSLKDTAAPANANYDFEFALFDALSGGNQVGAAIARNTVLVTNGIFAVKLDFGNQFPGTNRYLEIRVRVSGQPTLTTLTPRQPVNSSPYSVKTLNADNATNATNANNATASTNFTGPLAGDVTGTQSATAIANNAVTNAKLADSSVTAAKIASGQVVRAVNGLTDNVTLVAGSNVTITPAGNTLTIASTGGTVNAILNQTTQQAGANFNISGDGTAGGTLSGNAVNTGTQYNIGSSRILSNPGTQNLFAGAGAGALNTGSGNSFFGNGAGQANTTGTSNLFSGLQAGLNNTTGNSNSFVGPSAGFLNTTGGDNSFIGEAAGQTNTTGSNNTVIGFFANVSTGNLNNATAIGANAIVSSSNSLVLGSPGTNVGIGTSSPIYPLSVVTPTSNYGFTHSDGTVTVGSFVGSGGGWYGTKSPHPLYFFTNDSVARMTITTSGAVGIGTSTPAQTLDVNGQARIHSIPTLPTVGQVCFNAAGDLLQCGASSLRWKTNVQQFHSGLDVIRRLQPISFNWKDGGAKDIGLAAEEVAKIAPSLAMVNSTGEVEGVKYERLNIVLINAVKEQQTQIAMLLKANAALNTRVRAVERRLPKKHAASHRRH